MPRKPRTAPRKIPRQARSRQTVDAVLDATARVLVKAGYTALTTNRVAEVAGVSVGSLYQYFPSKDALVDALLERHLETVRRVVFAAMAGLGKLSLREATRAMVGALAAAHAGDPSLHRVLLSELPRASRMRRLRDWEQTLHGAIVAFLETHRAELRVTDLPTAAFVVLVAVDGMMTASILFQPDLTAFDVVDETTTLVMRYLVRDPERTR